MRLTIKSLVTMCAIYFLAAGVVMAEPADVVFIDEGGCGLLNDDGIPVAGEGHEVSANSSNGNVKLTCSINLEPTSTGRSVIYNYDTTGILCGTSGGSTDDWHEVISRSGQAKLTCHFKTN